MESGYHIRYQFLTLNRSSYSRSYRLPVPIDWMAELLRMPEAMEEYDNFCLGMHCPCNRGHCSPANVSADDCGFNSSFTYGCGCSPIKLNISDLWIWLKITTGRWIAQIAFHRLVLSSEWRLIDLNGRCQHIHSC